MSEPKSAKGLMAFWAKIDSEYVMRFQQWHNCEHVPERVAIPGFLRGRRYRDNGGEPFFLMFYETVDAGTLGSAAYLAALNSPTPWTKEALTHFREPARNIYSLLREWGRGGENASPYAMTMRFNIPIEGRKATLKTIEDNWLTSVAEIEGIRRVRLYEVDENITSITTSERKIYGDGPGAQQFLIFVEAEIPEAAWVGRVESLCASSFGNSDPRKNIRSDRFWLEFGYLKQN